MKIIYKEDIMTPKETIIRKLVERTIKNLDKNGFECYIAKDKAHAVEIARGFVKEGDTVAGGGSMTIVDTGIDSMLREFNCNYMTRDKTDGTPEGMRALMLNSFDSDVYFGSSNAITEDGILFNVDGNGNRVAAYIYGPKTVVIVVGYNKIVRDIDEAIKRNAEVAAPANGVRLDLSTPCAKEGRCFDCRSPERMCCDYVAIGHVRNRGRIKVVIMLEEAGY